MKRVIPILILLTAAVAAGFYYYPRMARKPVAANELTLSGNIEAHEALVSFKVPGPDNRFTGRRRAAGGARCVAGAA